MSFSINGNTIKITRGDTGVFTLTIKDGDTDYDYSNDAVLFTVKQNTRANDHVIQKTVQYGENITITPADTQSLGYGSYVYDVELTTAGGIVDTIIEPSPFIIGEEVTFNYE